MVSEGAPEPWILRYLPEAYRGDDLLAAFLGPVQAVFDELRASVTGPGDGTGGLPDLFDPATTPPAQLRHHGGDDFAFLDYLASWRAIPLRPEKPVEWNRRYLARAIALAGVRGTLAGVDGLLRAWLDGDLLDPPGRELLVITDLASPVNGVDSPFQLGVQSLLGVHTVLGEPSAHFFVADLVIAPDVRDLRDPVGLDALQRAARTLLDAEKPAYTYYELRVRGRPMQLAPADPAEHRPGEIYAQLEDRAADPPVSGTALLWDEPGVFAG
jgi:phage tail-like protein